MFAQATTIICLGNLLSLCYSYSTSTMNENRKRRRILRLCRHRSHWQCLQHSLIQTVRPVVSSERKVSGSKLRREGLFAQNYWEQPAHLGSDGEWRTELGNQEAGYQDDLLCHPGLCCRTTTITKHHCGHLRYPRKFVRETVSASHIILTHPNLLCTEHRKAVAIIMTQIVTQSRKC